MRVDRAGLGQAVPLWTAVLTMLATAGGAGYLGAWLAAREVENDLALRPPVLVLDVATAARGADPERIADVLAGHNATVRRLAEAGVPDDLKYVALAESALRPHAGSPKGAIGFWQFLADTGRKYGLTINARIDERRNKSCRWRSERSTANLFERRAGLNHPCF